MARRVMFVVLPLALGGCCLGGDECSGGSATPPATPPAIDITGRWQVPFAFCGMADLTLRGNVVGGTCRSAATPPQTYAVEGYIAGETLSLGVVLAGNPTYVRAIFSGKLAPGDPNRFVGTVQVIPRSAAPASPTAGEMVRAP